MNEYSVHFIKSGMGTGKGELIRSLIEQCTKGKMLGMRRGLNINGFRPKRVEKSIEYAIYVSTRKVMTYSV